MHKRQKLKKNYNDVYGRLCIYHAARAAKIKKSDINLQHIARMSM